MTRADNEIASPFLQDANKCHVFESASLPFSSEFRPSRAPGKFNSYVSFESPLLIVSCPNKEPN